MIRTRLLLQLKRYHGDHSHNKQNLESISDKPFFKHYQQGIVFSLENKLQESNSSFRESLKAIGQSKQGALEHYSYILKRMSLNHRRLGQFELAEERLYDIIKQKQQHGAVPAVLYDDYDLLFKHLITYNLEKAVKLCKALLTRSKDDMPVSHVKIFTMNLGIAYLLAGNYQDSKKRLSKCLDSDPQGKIKAYALNNLGVACWWHKNPLDAQKIESGSLQTISNQFDQAKQLFCKSLRQTQKLDKMVDQQRKFLMNQTLSLQTEKLQEKLEFQHPQSIFPLFNLSQYYLENDPIRKSQILYLYTKSMSLSKKIENNKIFDRIYVQYSLLNSRMQQLLTILPALINKYRDSQQFVQQSYYCKVLAKIHQINNNSHNSDSFILRAQTIDKVIPIWASKLKYIAYDQLNLTL